MAMKRFSKRVIFTVIMSLSATLLAVIIAGQKLKGQPDLFADLAKISLIIAIGTACMSFFYWTLTHLKSETAFRGGLAGLLTAITVVPLPAFGWTFKTQFMAAYTDMGVGIMTAIFTALPPAIRSGIYTFEDITKASVIAVIGSIAAGVAVSYLKSEKTLKA